MSTITLNHEQAVAVENLKAQQQTASLDAARAFSGWLCKGAQKGILLQFHHELAKLVPGLFESCDSEEDAKKAAYAVLDAADAYWDAKAEGDYGEG